MIIDQEDLQPRPADDWWAKLPPPADTPPASIDDRLRNLSFFGPQ